MNNLSDWLHYLEKIHPATIEMGLERIQQVTANSGLFNFSCPVVVVGGTNGKGSTVGALAKLLMSAGKKVGTYTSPHFLYFNERIQINGQCVSDTQLIEAFTQVESLRQNTPLTFFEFTTLAALIIFQSCALDALILEVGLGGRLDAVNCVSGDLTIITSIGLDHTDLLGKTLESIAKEKAGILRPRVPVLLGETANIEVIRHAAQELNCPISVPEKKCGNHLPDNSVALAQEAYTLLRDKLTLPPLDSHWLLNAKMVGRFYSVQVADKTVIFDVAHNGQASHWLSQKLSSIEGKIYALWASLADKALMDIIEPLKTRIDTWYIPDLNVERCDIKKMLNALVAQKIERIFSFADIKEAFSAVLEVAKPKETIVVFGSFYTVAQGLKALNFTLEHFQGNSLHDT